MQILNIILPTFIIILTGLFFGFRRKEKDLKTINDYVLYVALPALFLKALVGETDFHLLTFDFFVISLIGIGLSFLAGYFLFKKSCADTSAASIMGMASSYGTTGYMGLPILMLIFSEKALMPASISAILHNIPVILVVALMLELGRNSKNNKERNAYRSAFASITKIILTNPFILSTIVGVLINLSGIDMPTYVNKTIDMLALSAAPVALFTLGLSLSGLKRTTFKRAILGKIFLIVFIKNFFHPLITGLLIFYFSARSFNDIWNVSSIVMAAQPIGASVLAFSYRYRLFEEEISLAIAVSIALAVFTLFLTLTLLI